MPHLPFTGFAAALVTGPLCGAAGGSTGRFAALGMPAGTLRVFARCFRRDRIHLAGAVPPTAGMQAAALRT
ncbi:YndJ family transporter [Streptomyces pacificus]|uniref:Uncharacterized protein n=1 Tax=Streptomyces pacificus TaxID=2705029 RepID=A0A6A0AZQ6_9ACTN|nr:hypothetical protein [Streptomyces pacificus]GFH37958.1 hypothetical protein SCWH03_41980 [Streptomyces pacificus]